MARKRRKSDKGSGKRKGFRQAPFPESKPKVWVPPGARENVKADGAPPPDTEYEGWVFRRGEDSGLSP